MLLQDIECREFPGGPVVRTLLSLLRSQVHSLVGELKSHSLGGVVKTKKRRKRGVQNRQYVRSFPAFSFYKFMVRRED